jgi:hypothetical protein
VLHVNAAEIFFGPYPYVFALVEAKVELWRLCTHVAGKSSTERVAVPPHEQYPVSGFDRELTSRQSKCCVRVPSIHFGAFLK